MTLSELLKDNKTWPVKVRRLGWADVSWVDIIADWRGRSYPAFDSFGAVCAYNGDDEDWSFYPEPRAMPRYAWMSMDEAGSCMSSLYFTAYDKRDPTILGERWVRVPELDLKQN